VITPEIRQAARPRPKPKYVLRQLQGIIKITYEWDRLQIGAYSLPPHLPPVRMSEQLHAAFVRMEQKKEPKRPYQNGNAELEILP